MVIGLSLTANCWLFTGFEYRQILPSQFVFGRRGASYIQQIEGQTTEVRKCRSFLKDSVVYPWYELLSNAVGLWSVFLPLSAHKRMNEIVEESQKLANPIWQRYEKKGYRYPFHEEVLKERKIEKKV